MLETLSETIWRLLLQVSTILTQQKQNIAQYANAFAHNKPHLKAAINPAIQMGVFDMLKKSESAKIAGELAIITDRDKLLIGERLYSCHTDLSDSIFPVRILRPLNTKHILIETGLKANVAEPGSKAFANTISSKIALRPWIGARAYFFCSICHDWSDAKRRQLLSNTVAAMERG